MKRTTFAMAMLLAASMAQAATAVIDNFDAPDINKLSTTVGNTNTATDAVRTASITLLQGPANGSGSSLTIGSQTYPRVGALEIDNASLRQSLINVSWSLADLLPADTASANLVFEVVESDGNPVTLDFMLNNASFISYVVAPNTTNSPVSLALSAAQFGALDNSLLTLRISGFIGYDLTLDNLGVSYEVTPVPEPRTYALMLAGLAALGFVAARRRVG